MNIKLLSGSVALALTIGVGAVPSGASEKPNVVLMLADNVGYGDIGAYGGGAMRGMPTPVLDQLAAEGLQLTQFLVEPGCTPSRAALMTGRYSVRSGLGTIILGGLPNTLQEEEFTLGEMFKSVGYSTAIVGKWHLGFEEQSWPTRQGFDEYRVGVIETSESTLYRPNMERARIDEATILEAVPHIYESDGQGNLTPVREYTLEYRRQIESDIADAAVNYIARQAAAETPFFLYIGWTHTHYPSLTAPEFTGKSTHRYGDAMMELDHRTGQVLQAIEDAGIEDNTIVLWMSDNGASPDAAPWPDKGGSNGPFRGELGDPTEGSIRTVGMIRWPEKIKPGKTNEMVAIHDILPTLASIVGADLPDDRPYDGVDQSAFLLGQQDMSKREHLLTHVNNKVAALRWRHFRIYPKAYRGSFSNPSQEGLLGVQVEKNGGPDIFNIEMDPREEYSISGDNAWVVAQWLRFVAEYNESLREHPNPPGVTLTDPDFGK
ncbi:steryl-sulfatase [Sulfitobacter sp. JL08]|uniref:arylsulfatase n=1 Tax=Sulfitobacter sp. JL08 TaxID=2070369 RepID=UPI000E0C6BD5|nr:arylsulfatase [Sulfitobacter sp. JL08]AXI55499.1 steryl-sulfatase [Sulfitobacter sp. JL08]